MTKRIFLENTIEPDNVTLDDCIILAHMKNIHVVLEDGRITSFIEENICWY
jgi:hypothetical protein|nr:MAG TPA: hypothetical protein [Caudoviricetes sp.]